MFIFFKVGFDWVGAVADGAAKFFYRSRIKLIPVRRENQ
jgi:hypothetical protein